MGINMSERWKPVVGYEGLYVVSDKGRVRSVDRTIERFSKHGKTYTHRLRGRLKTATPRCGYPSVGLHDGDGGRTRPVHRLVLEAFVGPCPPGMECCHFDGDRSNAHLENLRWDTRFANEDDRARHATQKAVKSELQCEHPSSPGR